MSQVILKKSSVPGKVPLVTDLAYGELAINYADGIAYFKKSDNTIGTIGSSAFSQAQNYTYTATAGQTSFACNYDFNRVYVYLNGVKQVLDTDFTASTGTSIDFVSGLIAGDIVDIVSYSGSNDIPPLPTTDIIGASDVQTLTNKTISFANNTLSGVQAELLSGTNIKTINNTSILGSGNISIVETDPVFVASAAYDITSTNITNWNSAYSWGNHANAGYLTSISSSQVTTALGYTPINITTKGAVNGIASLDSSGLVPSTQLPSYVDDVLEYAALASFPATGETGKIYVDLTTNKTYRWSGSTYVYITSGAVDSVAGKTGVVTLVKGDVGLGSVDNTADANKNVLSATKLTTARTISLTGDVTGSVSFDGSGNAAIATTIAADSVTLGTDTTGNYVASISNGSYITGGNGGSEGAAITLAVDATSANTASKVVARDASGNFSAGTITATLSGNAATATILQTARNINGVSFNGSADITITAANPNALTIGTGLSGTSYNGSAAVTVALATGYGDTQNPYASKTANYFLAAPNGTAGAPTFRAIVAADIPTLNQNTTGTASNVTGTVAIANGGTGATTAAAALTNLGAYPATNPSGYTTNTGTVTSVSGTGTVSGLTLTGTVTTSGNLTLGGTLSVSIDNISDEYRVFNNMGNNHSTTTDFNAVGNFGVRYLQGGTNGPTGNGQWYGFTLGLGNDYTISQYASQLYWSRKGQTSDNRYIYTRDLENGTWGSWVKMHAGYADTAGNGGVTSVNGQTGAVTISGGATVTDDTTTNATRYIVWEDITSGSSSTIGVSSTKLYFNPSTGTLNATTFNSLSDINQKTNLIKIENATETLSHIDTFEFDWIDNGKHSAGVIAQHLEKILPFLVDTSDSGMKSVNYPGLIAYLVQSNKELNHRLTMLERKI